MAWLALFAYDTFFLLLPSIFGFFTYCGFFLDPFGASSVTPVIYRLAGFDGHIVDRILIYIKMEENVVRTKYPPCFPYTRHTLHCVLYLLRVSSPPNSQRPCIKLGFHVIPPPRCTPPCHVSLPDFRYPKRKTCRWSVVLPPTHRATRFFILQPPDLQFPNQCLLVNIRIPASSNPIFLIFFLLIFRFSANLC